MRLPAKFHQLPAFLAVTLELLTGATNAEINWVGEDLVNRARQAVVHLESTSLGGVSGFYVSADGLIMTNAAALEGMTSTTVINASQERIQNVRLVALFPEHNLALLKSGRRPPVYLNIRKNAAGVSEPCVVAYQDGRGGVKVADGILLNRGRILDWTEMRLQEQWSVGLAPDKIGLAGAPMLTADGCVAGVCVTYMTEKGGVHSRTSAIPESALQKALALARSSRGEPPWPKPGEITGYVLPATQDFHDAMKFVNSGQHQLAIDKLEDALALQPGNAHIIWHLANACLVTDRLNDGEKWLQECVRLSPQKLMPYVQLSIVKKNRGDPEAAEKLLRHLLGKEPGLPRAWAALARLLAETGRGDEALEASKKWTETQPDSIEAWEYHASLLVNAGDIGGAGQARDKASEIDSLLFKIRYSAPKRH